MTIGSVIDYAHEYVNALDSDQSGSKRLATQADFDSF